jgi:hypothetical protein
MGGEYPKGRGAIFLGHSPLWGGRYSKDIRPPGVVFLGISPPFERGANLLGGTKVLGQKSWDKSPVTTAWANSSTFLKILSCPPKIYVCPSNAPPNSEAWRRHCAQIRCTK